MSNQLSKEQSQKISDLVSKARVMNVYDLKTFRENVSVSDGDNLIKDEVIKKIDIMLNNKAYCDSSLVKSSHIKDGDSDEY